jgi:hypothetical protein
MRVFAYLVLSLTISLVNVFGQTVTLGGTEEPVQKGTQQVRSEDGGVTETLQSIFIPPKPNAPFSLTLQTEWVKSLSDGGTITMINQRHISRDAKGRIFQERVYLVPKTDKYEPVVYLTQIADPNTHIAYNCFQDSRKECVQLSYEGSGSIDYKMPDFRTGDLPDGTGTASHEDLGKQSIEGVETVGTRDSITYNPGVFGNDLRLTIEREYWYSPKLGINLVSVRSDPRIGKQTFRVSEIILGAPSPTLFALPKGFKVVTPTQSGAKK